MKKRFSLTPDQITSLYKLKRKLDRRRGSPTPPLSDYLGKRKLPKKQERAGAYLIFIIIFFMGSVLYFQLGL
jgi:hypothetical protein